MPKGNFFAATLAPPFESPLTPRFKPNLDAPFAAYFFSADFAAVFGFRRLLIGFSLLFTPLNFPLVSLPKILDKTLLVMLPPPPLDDSFLPSDNFRVSDRSLLFSNSNSFLFTLLSSEISSCNSRLAVK